jgi:hypothetical protein
MEEHLVESFEAGLVEWIGRIFHWWYIGHASLEPMRVDE